MPEEHSFIANSGIQFITIPLSIRTQDKFKAWFHEWFDTDNDEWILSPVYELKTEDESIYYNKQEIAKAGYFADPTEAILPADLKNDGILPLRIDDELCPGVEGEVFSLSFTDKACMLRAYENEWLPVPYFFKRTPTKYKFGPLNWARLKLVPRSEEKGVKNYDAILAFDTRTLHEATDDYGECPVFPDRFRQSMEFSLCSNEYFVMDYCAPGERWSYVDRRLFGLAHPNVKDVRHLMGGNVRHMAYIATYSLLMSYLAENQLLPAVRLYKDVDVESRNVDMVVDIGNSRTTALLIEDNSSFNQVRKLELTDYTHLITHDENGNPERLSYSEPFDMRLAFRKATFGEFGMKDSLQFVYPSFVRLGREAADLIHSVCSGTDGGEETLSTYSSPKRYLWDWRPSRQEWRFLVLEGENTEPILNLRGISNQLRSDGTVDKEGRSGNTYRYSRRSLMTFSFLEMLVQAHRQVNSEEQRSVQKGFGFTAQPRKIRRIIVTCPTAMSKEEREALVRCAQDAVWLFDHFYGFAPEGSKKSTIEVIPSAQKPADEDEGRWYYDEATCAQLVYMYGEAGHKYKGCCNEFFSLYGKTEEGDAQPSITVGSLDIGAGTTDLMVSKYTYVKGDVTTVTPDPKFYDSFYFAGDDLLYGMVKNIMLLDESSAFRQAMGNLPFGEYRQRVKNFFGPDYNGQTAADRELRRNFNLQYSVPLMCHFLELLKTGSRDRQVTYADVFGESEPNRSVVDGFRERTGIDVTRLEWHFSSEAVNAVVRKELEPLLKKVATIMFSYACDVVLLSGRPASLPAVRDIFLKYYPVSPNRIIVLNGYYVGDWYPFGDNTGYIRDAKTIVAMGGVIAHYASAYANLEKFAIDLSRLRSGLKSTVNYIEASREGEPIAYFLTPDCHRGELLVTSVPTVLNVRQLGIDSYPSRALYTIDFNRHKMADRVRKRAILEGTDIPTDAKVLQLVRETVDALKKRMPFKLTIEREPDDRETLSLSAITDRNGVDVSDSNLEIHIQSLGASERYWLDSGEFDF